DIRIARLILAKCKVAEVDRIYGNPPSACTCPTCTELPPRSQPISCNCSGCVPDVISPITRPPRTSKVNTAVPKAKRLSKLQRNHGLQRLLALRLEIWKAADPAKFWMFPPSFFLPDAVITSILDNFVLLDTLDKVTQFIRRHRHLQHYPHRLLEVLEQL
ncbi:hypothetical protein C8R44DRAFT_592893, partial [Mycena epipterygia]